MRELTIRCRALGDVGMPLERLIVSRVDRGVELRHAQDVNDGRTKHCVLDTHRAREVAAWLGRMLHASTKDNGLHELAFGHPGTAILHDKLSVLPWTISTGTNNVIFGDDQAWELLGWLADYCAAVGAKATAPAV